MKKKRALVLYALCTWRCEHAKASVKAFMHLKIVMLIHFFLPLATTFSFSVRTYICNRRPLLAHPEHRFPAPSSKEECRKPVLGVCVASSSSNNNMNNKSVDL